MTKVALDTSVIVEYIDKKGELNEQAEAVISALLAGKLEAMIPHPILAETYYVATRLYQKLKVENPEAVASKLVEWIYRLPTTTIPVEDANLAAETGKAKLHYGLALTDCYVLATARINNCKAIFRKAEKEMQAGIRQLKQEYRLLFLKDYK